MNTITHPYTKPNKPRENRSNNIRNILSDKNTSLTKYSEINNGGDSSAKTYIIVN